MLFQNNGKQPRKRSYYPFSKNYPTKTGNTYEIGESRTKRKREERNRVIFYVSLIFLFALVFVIACVSLTLSRRPIQLNNTGKAAQYDGKLKALCLPDDALGGGIAYTLFKGELTDIKANAVVIDFKTDDGMLHYNSLNEDALSIGACATVYGNANNVIHALKDDGYKIIARVHCFKDPLAASVINGAAVKEADGETVWLDNSAQKDGNPWLNPFSDKAKEYLYGIISECVKTGADVVLLDSVCFPDSSRVSGAVFPGEETETQSRNTALHNFVSEAASLCGDIPLALYLNCDSALNGNDTLYAGSMFDSEAIFDAVDFRNSAVDGEIKIDSTVYMKDEINEGLCIGKSVPILKEKLDDNFSSKAIIPIISDKEYIEMLQNLGIENYILVK